MGEASRAPHITEIQVRDEAEASLLDAGHAAAAVKHLPAKGCSAPTMSLPPSPRSSSRMSMPTSPRSVRSVRSISSGSWDQLVDLIVTADPETGHVHDENGRHEPTIVEEEDEEERHGFQFEHYYRNPRQFNSLPARMPAGFDAAHASAQLPPARRHSEMEPVPAPARTSIVIDMRLFDALDRDVQGIDLTDLEKLAADDDKETRLSRSGSHSGSSTVNEPLEDRPRSKDHDGWHNAAEDTDVEARADQHSISATKAPYSAFPTRAKRIIVLSAASASIFAPLSMQIYLPSLTTLVTDFGVSRTQINLTVSVYMVFMAISPMAMGGIADVAGRRPALLVCFSMYMVACILIAMCDTYAELMGFRILQSIGASPTIAIASAVVSDIVTSSERGSYAALVALPVIFAPTLGPIIGGLLTQFLGWRSIFWFLLICGAVAFFSIGLFFPETCRLIVGDASSKAPKLYRSAMQAVVDQRPNVTESAEEEKTRLRGTTPRTTLLWNSLTSAVRILFTKERFLLLFYVGLIFSGFNAIATELPTQFKDIYGFDSVMIGVMYIPLAVGAMVSTIVIGKQMNKNFRKYAARQGINIEAGQQVDMDEFPIEQARLEITFPSLIISTAGIVCWGWVLEQRTTVAAPCVLLFVLGCGLNGVMASTNALLMDVSQAQAGAVMAASNLTRCALGAVASAVIQPMIDRLGLGWSYVVYGGLFLVFSPVLALQYSKGLAWRQQARDRHTRLLLQRNMPAAADTLSCGGAAKVKAQAAAAMDGGAAAAAAAPGIPLVDLPVKRGERARNSACSNE